MKHFEVPDSSYRGCETTANLIKAATEQAGIEDDKVMHAGGVPASDLSKQ